MASPPTETSTSFTIPILTTKNGTRCVPTYSVDSATPIIGIRARPGLSNDHSSQDLTSASTATEPPFKNFNPTQSLIIEFTPVSLEQVDYIRLISKIEIALDAQYKHKTGIVVTGVRAIWEDKAMGPSFTKIHEGNVKTVMGLVGKGTPWTYLIFEYGAGKALEDKWSRSVERGGISEI